MKKVKCLLSVLLMVTMVFSLIPVYAASPEGNTEHTITDNISAPPDTKINMFDYWVIGKQDDADNDVQIDDMHEVVGGGINQNHLLLFGNCDGAYSGIDESDWCKSTVGEWNCYTGDAPEKPVLLDGPGNPYRGIVSEELGDDGYPKLDLREGHIVGSHDISIPEVYFDETARIKTDESLAYLFDPNETNQPGKAVYENASGLLRKNDNGYYYFNSDNNNCFAELNTANGENNFVLYETPWLYKDKPQFFPFGNHTDLVNGQDCDVTGEEVNHYFGMTMEYEFTQPKDGIVKTDTLGDKDMTFEISGDDDIWVFIDNKLAIDMGGIHEKCRAEINFKTGVIDYYNDAGVKFRTVYLSYAMGERSGELDSEKWKTLQDGTNGNNFSVGTFADNTIHTMKVFYLERGNNDSDFGIKFNTPPAEYTSVWQFGYSNNGGIDYGSAEHKATADAPLDIDATQTNMSEAPKLKVDVSESGAKFGDGGRTDEWCNVGTGTKFTVPVKNGSEITFGSYNNQALLDVDGYVFNSNGKFTYYGTAETLTLNVNAGSYMSFIRVKTPVTPEAYDATEHNVTVDSTIDAAQGSVTTEPSVTAPMGKIVTITATPTDAYKVKNGGISVQTASGNPVTLSGDKFQMPAEDVTVTVVFEVKVTEQPNSIDYEMNFASTNPVVDGVTISDAKEYKLFDDFVVLNGLNGTNDHGLQGGSGSIKVQVPGKVKITFGACGYDDVKFVVTPEDGEPIESKDIVGDQRDLAAGGKGSYKCYDRATGTVSDEVTYDGEANTLTITFAATTTGTLGRAEIYLPYLHIQTVE